MRGNAVSAIVIGAVEVVTCNAHDPACPPDGRWLYNTAFAMGNNGSVLAKYRKAHLFSESACLDAAAPAAVAFALPGPPPTLTIGLLVCYDIEYHASVSGVLALGVDAIALPMQWLNTIPVSSAQALQQAVSWAYNTTLVAVRRLICVCSWV